MRESHFVLSTSGKSDVSLRFLSACLQNHDGGPRGEQ